MAEILTLNAAAAQAILGASVVSGAISEAGHLILTRSNGQTIDAGDFNAIVGEIQQAELEAAVNPVVVSEVYNKVSGTLFNRGDVAGAMSFTDINNVNLVNALFLVHATGNIGITATNLPANCKPGTQFAMRITQDATGSRTLTLVGFKRSYGLLTLTTTPNAIDILVFMYDGTNWFVGPMGLDFR